MTLRLAVSVATEVICDDPDGPGHAPRYLDVRQILMIEPPIVFAVRARNYDLVHKRINMGLDINYIDRNGDNALNAACQRQEYEIIKLLLQSGADPKSTDGNGRTAFQIAYGKGKVLAILNGLDESSFELSDDCKEYTKIRLPPEIRWLYSAEEIHGMLNAYGCVQLTKSKHIKEVKVESAADELTIELTFELCELVNFIAINELNIVTNLRTELDVIGIQVVEDSLFKSCTVFIGDGGKMGVTVARCIDGEHDLHISFGIRSLIKSVWIE